MDRIRPGKKLWDRNQDSQREQAFRYRNRVHNTITVNNELQKMAGYAPITGFSDRASFVNATTDATGVYQGALSKANRGIAIVDGAYVVVRDEIEAQSVATTVRWMLLTAATVKIPARTGRSDQRREKTDSLGTGARQRHPENLTH